MTILKSIRLKSPLGLGLLLLTAAILAIFYLGEWADRHGLMRWLILGAGGVVALIAGVNAAIDVINGATAINGTSDDDKTKNDRTKAFLSKKKLQSELFSCIAFLSLLSGLFSYGLQQDRANVFARWRAVVQAEVLTSQILQTKDCNRYTRICVEIRADFKSLLTAVLNPEGESKIRKSAQNLLTNMDWLERESPHPKHQEAISLIEAGQLHWPFLEPLAGSLVIVTAFFVAMALGRKVGIATYEHRKPNRPLTIKSIVHRWFRKQKAQD